MQQWKIRLIFATFMACFATAYAESPAGLWTSFDESNGQKRALIKINVAAGTLNGVIVKVYPQPGDTGVCAKCPGKFKDKPIQGLQFIWDLKDVGQGVWTGGEILDPKTGKIYKVKMTLKENKLYVRGYAGISIFGRTQTWIR